MLTRIRLAALAAVLLMLCTGCIRYRATAVIDDAGTVSGSVIIGYSPELIELAKQLNGPGFDPLAELKAFLDANAAAVSTGSTSVAPYAADGFTGFETTFTNVAPAEYLRLLRHEDPNAGESPGVVFRLDRSGDEWVFSAELEDPKPGQIELPAEAFKDVDIVLALTFPGPVVSTNGEVSGNTVTWRPKPPRPGRLEAIGKAGTPAPAENPGVTSDPTPAPAAARSDDGGGGLGAAQVAIIVGAAVLLAAACLTLFLRRRAGRP